MISHEIRTPLNAIIGIGHLLGLHRAAPAQQKYVRILRSSSESCWASSTTSSTSARSNPGKVTLEERSFDPRQLVYGIVYGLQVKAEEKGVALDVSVDEASLPSCSGIRSRSGRC